MADSSAMKEIRGIDIDKLAKGFADEENILKKYVVQSKTKAREIRWYQKTSGFLDVPETTDVGAFMDNVSFKARPFVTEQSWTRQVSYIKKFFVESPMISMEDIKDSDIDILATNVRDLVRGVGRKVDGRIFFILAECLPATPTTPLTASPQLILSTAAVGTGWDDSTDGNPIKDILIGKQKIRAQGYNPEGSMIGMNSVEHQLLLDYLINQKGSSIPNFASEKVKTGVVMEILGCNLVVSENFTTDWVYQWIPSRSVTWKAFMPITSVVIDEPGIGKKIRVWEEGEALLTDPKSVHIISDTIT